MPPRNSNSSPESTSSAHFFANAHDLEIIGGQFTIVNTYVESEAQRILLNQIRHDVRHIKVILVVLFVTTLAPRSTVPKIARFGIRTSKAIHRYLLPLGYRKVTILPPGSHDVDNDLRWRWQNLSMNSGRDCRFSSSSTHNDNDSRGLDAGPSTLFWKILFLYMLYSTSRRLPPSRR